MGVEGFDQEHIKRSILVESLRREGIKWSRYIPHEPTPQQRKFLALKCKEALYGGAAGGGKSDALLMAALQYADVPGYSAILFRKTFADLNLSEALIPRAHEWLAGTDAKWDEKTKTYHFPAPASLSFGYLETALDHFRYQGSAFQFLGVDELTQHKQNQYKYLFSRLRRLVGIDIPLRAWSSSNPGGIGHAWVKRNFILPWRRRGGKPLKSGEKGSDFVPAKVYDNPFLDVDEYIDSLGYLDTTTMAQLLDGDWDITDDNPLVYPLFERETHMVEPPSYDPAYYGGVWAGVDPGTRDHYAVSIWAREKSGIGWWKLDEFYKTGGTTLEFLPLFRKLQEVYQCKRWWVDKRKPEDIKDLKSGGLPAAPNLEWYAEDKKHTIRPMINVLVDLWKHEEIRISNRCKWTAEELELYHYEEIGDKNAGETPVDFKNHLMDADRYCIVSVENVPALRARYRKPPDMKPRDRNLVRTTKIGTAHDYLAAQEKRFGEQRTTRLNRYYRARD